MKKILLSLISIICIATSVFLGACGEKTSTYPDIVPKPAKIYFSESTYVVDKFSMIELNCNYSGNETVAWSTTAKDTVFIKDGVIVALSVGSAQITASVEGEKAICTINVVATNVYPTLSVSQESVELLVGATKTIGASLSVGQKTIKKDFVEYSYQSLDEDKIKVDENGVITALNAGTGRVKVTATYAGETLEEFVSVSVKENVSLLFNKAKIVLYTNSLLGEKQTSDSVIAYAYENDLPVQDAQITWSSDNSEIATVDNGVITGIKQGDVMIEAKYVSTGGTEVSSKIPVKVIYSEVVTSDEYFIEMAAGEFNINISNYAKYFEEQMTNIEVTDDLGKEIATTLNDTNITVDCSTLNYGFREFNILINSEVIFKVKAEVVTKILYTANDLSSFAKEYGNLDEETGNYSGYFMLGDNIDMTNTAVEVSLGRDGYALFNTPYSEYGFSGIFDGKGYTIYNATTNIFGRVSDTGIIKNTSFVSDINVQYGIVAVLFSGTMENCYISTTMNAQEDNSAPICYRTVGKATLRNVVINVTEFNSTAINVSTLISNANEMPTIENVYVLSPTKDNPVVNSGILKGSITQYATSDKKDFLFLDKSSDLWVLVDDVYVFESSKYFNLEKLGVVDKQTIVVSTDGVASWVAVENASGYIVSVNGIEEYVDTNSINGIKNCDILKIKAMGDGTEYRNGEFSSEYVYIKVENPYLADYSSAIYESLIRANTHNGGAYATDIEAEYVAEYKGEKNVLKITSTLNANNTADFILKLPKGRTGNGVTFRYIFGEQSCEPGGRQILNVDSTRQYMLGGNFDFNKTTWTNIYVDLNNPPIVGDYIQTTKDELGFGLWGGTVGEKVIIYISMVLDGQYSDEQINEMILSSVKESLLENYLADYSSTIYESLIRANTNNGDNYVADIEAEYVAEYKGEKNVLKITSTLNANNTADFILKLPKGRTGDGVTFRYIFGEESCEPAGRVILNVDALRQYVSSDEIKFNKNEWSNIYVDLTKPYFAGEECVQTTKDELGFGFWQGVVGEKVVIYIAWVYDGQI